MRLLLFNVIFFIFYSLKAQHVVFDTVCFSGGRFQMGSVGVTDKHYLVELSPFCICRYEVTNSQYTVFLNENKHFTSEQISRFINLDGESVEQSNAIYFDWKENKYKVRQGFENHPVVYVSWEGAHEFARWAGGLLPTEAQWEYVCRAGTDQLYATGHCLTDADANFDARKVQPGCPKGHFLGKSLPVGTFNPNQFGVYDIHGNVFEWCLDWFAEYSEGFFPNPSGPNTGQNKIRRGGSFMVNAKNCSCFHRSIAPPTAQFKDLGFRLVFVK